MYFLVLDDDGILRTLDRSAVFNLWLECFDYFARNAVLVDENGNIIDEEGNVIG